MEKSYVTPQNIETLEDYAMSLAYGMISLKTLENIHIEAINKGLLTEDLTCRANTIIWDIRRDIRLYQQQLEDVLDFIPDETLDIPKIIERLKPKKKP